MDSSDRVKALIYGEVLHFSHLYEQKLDLELMELQALGHAQDLNGIPGSLSTIHVLDCIGNHEPINHTAIAEKLNLSKASITKISTKLLAGGFINRVQLNDNRKEVYFRLTPEGNKLFKLHEALHHKEEQRFLRFLDGFSESELGAILKFFHGMAEQINERQ